MARAVAFLFVILTGLVAGMFAPADAAAPDLNYDSASTDYDAAQELLVIDPLGLSFAQPSGDSPSTSELGFAGTIGGKNRPALGPAVDFVAPRTGGATLVADDARSIRVADRAPVAAGEHNVVLHGDSNGFIGASVDEVAAAVRADPTYGGQRICLLSCNSASNGSAQALATDLGVPVRAPTGRVGLPQPPHAPVVTLDVGSEWQWFYPGGP